MSLMQASKKALRPGFFLENLVCRQVLWILKPSKDTTNVWDGLNMFFQHVQYFPKHAENLSFSLSLSFSFFLEFWVFFVLSFFFERPKKPALDTWAEHASYRLRTSLGKFDVKEKKSNKVNWQKLLFQNFWLSLKMGRNITCNYLSLEGLL